MALIKYLSWNFLILQQKQHFIGTSVQRRMQRGKICILSEKITFMSSSARNINETDPIVDKIPRLLNRTPNIGYDHLFIGKKNVSFNLIWIIHIQFLLVLLYFEEELLTNITEMVLNWRYTINQSIRSINLSSH